MARPSRPTTGPGSDFAKQFKKQFENASVFELVSAFNGQVGCSGWGTTRGFYLGALKRALLASGWDCSRILDGDTLRFGRRIKFQSGGFVPIDDGRSRSARPLTDWPVDRINYRPQRATEYFKQIGPETWWVVGSGAAYGDGIETNAKFERVLEALSHGGIEVKVTGHGLPGTCDSFTFSSDFTGGRLEVTTGNFFGQRGGTVTGCKALKRLIDLLGLKLSHRTARRWGISRQWTPSLVRSRKRASEVGAIHCERAFVD